MLKLEWKLVWNHYVEWYEVLNERYCWWSILFSRHIYSKWCFQLKIHVVFRCKIEEFLHSFQYPALLFKTISLLNFVSGVVMFLSCKLHLLSSYLFVDSRCIKLLSVGKTRLIKLMTITISCHDNQNVRVLCLICVSIFHILCLIFYVFYIVYFCST